MQIFQKTVLKEFVALQNQDEIKNAFDKFQAHFANKNIQENIKNAKEEQYQEGFLQDLFVNILGYTLNPQKDFNLISEQKTQNSAKKSDGAILKNGKVIGVIELKSMKTILLEDIQKQAFEYKNSHIDCKYIITSNFKKLRFYLENNVEYEDFDLFDLSFERFSVLYSVLHCKSILQDKPIKLKKESTEREEKLTLEFYNDYQGFKEALFLNIKENNKNIDELLIFQKTQKLLDRIIFMSFAKDKGLLPANYIKIIIQEWELYKQIGEKKNLYEVFKKHFDFINNGFSSEKYDIYAFNGGLFEFDEILDNFKIGDNILKNQSEYISRYDFESDIDVNVLGHIFEFSLAELDKKKAELSQKAKDLAAGKKPKEQPKRKEYGIFYTPIYITDYMIEETLGKMCENKKTELSFENITIDKINRYRNWLLSVTVLDPACGSGAFLNQVLTFFIKEHQKLDELLSNLSNEKIVSNIYHQILENNIFGVDINLESISITKLSLWLRIAQGKRKLNDLSQNIKIGNSLIADKNIDEKAFDWTKEFSKMGDGFSLIVGNPPYFNISKDHLLKNSPYYSILANGITNVASLFAKLSIDLAKKDGIISLIIPKSFLNVTSWLPLRKILFQETLLMVSDMGKAFDEVGLEQAIFILKKQELPKEHLVKIMKYKEFVNKISQNFFIEKSIILTHLDFEKFTLIQKIEKNTVLLGEMAEMPRGITFSSEVYQEKKNNENVWILGGTNVKRYFIENGGKRKPNRYLEVRENIFNGKKEIFTSKRIIYQNIASSLPKIVATIVENFVTDDTLNNIILSDKTYTNEYILALLNSKLFTFYLKYGIINNSTLTVHLDKPYVGRFPIKKIDAKKQVVFIDKINKIFELYPILQENQKTFLSLLETNFGEIKFSQKIENWFLLDVNTFIKELQKSKKGISLQTQKKWITFFKDEQPETKSIAEKIQTLEKEIDNLVYELYNLTKEEIQLIENQ